jgi:hypothetical protein
MLCPFGIFHGQLVNFMPIWYAYIVSGQIVSFSGFGILYRDKDSNFQGRSLEPGNLHRCIGLYPDVKFCTQA